MWNAYESNKKDKSKRLLFHFMRLWHTQTHTPHIRRKNVDINKIKRLQTENKTMAWVNSETTTSGWQSHSREPQKNKRQQKRTQEYLSACMLWIAIMASSRSKKGGQTNRLSEKRKKNREREPLTATRRQAQRWVWWSKGYQIRVEQGNH